MGAEVPGLARCCCSSFDARALRGFFLKARMCYFFGSMYTYGSRWPAACLRRMPTTTQGHADWLDMVRRAWPMLPNVACTPLHGNKVTLYGSVFRCAEGAVVDKEEFSSIPGRGGGQGRHTMSRACGGQ